MASGRPADCVSHSRGSFGGGKAGVGPTNHVIPN